MEPARKGFGIKGKPKSQHGTNSPYSRCLSFSSTRVAAALIAAVILIVGVQHPRAQDDKAPSIPNPTPLEKERIGPEPTPGLKVPSIPGTQTIVLREYVPTLKPDQAITPVVLHIPDKFFSRTTDQPAEVWGINLLVQYPTMEPLSKTLRPCKVAWCGDEILIHLEVDRKPRSQGQAERNEHQVAMQNARDDPLIIASRKDPPPGYSEAYVQSYPKRRAMDTELVYVKRNAGGLATEFVDCWPKTPNPLCEFYIALTDVPSLQVDYSVSMKYWDERNDVRAAVEKLIGSFFPALVTNK